MIINEYGMIEEMRPFELLKLIRDGVLVKLGEVYWFEDSTIDHSPLDVIKALRELGWIEVSKDEEDIKPTERMLRALRGLHFSLTRLAPYGANSIVANPLFGRPKEPPIPSDLFVIMPFAEALRAVYDDHIRAVADRLGITSTRGDDFFAANSIISDVWNAITHAKVLVGDCTGRNPNVFYELGIAHTLGKPVILIAQSKDDIPFDIQHIRTILYNFTPQGMRDFEDALEATIKRELEWPRTFADILSGQRRTRDSVNRIIMRVQSDLQSISRQLEVYRDFTGMYPTGEQGLRALVEPPQTGPEPRKWYQLFHTLPKDLWDHDYIYRCPGPTGDYTSYDLFSAGPGRCSRHTR